MKSIIDKSDELNISKHSPESFIDKCIDNQSILKGPPIIIALSNEKQVKLLAHLRSIDQPLLNYEAVISSARGEHQWNISGISQENISHSVNILDDSVWSEVQDNWLDEAVRRDFNEFKPISNVDSVVDNPATVARRQVGILCELISYQPSTEKFTNLCVIHTYLCTYFAIIDSYFDGHGENNVSFLDAGPLLPAIHERIQDIMTSCSMKPSNVPSSELKKTLLLQRSSLIAEAQFRKQPFIPAEIEERNSIIGRASCYLFMLDFISFLNGHNVSNKIRSGIEEYLFLSQFADDLGDWREDYKQKNFTSFLRGCFKSLGFIPEENILEKAIYMQGLYESRLVRIIQGMDKIALGIAKDANRFPLTYQTITNERQRLYEILLKFVEAKQLFSV
jgi:hypothetical protein